MRFVATLACAFGVLVLAGCAGTSLSVQQSFAPAAGDRFAYELAPQVEIPADALLILDTRLKGQLVDRRSTSTAPANRRVDITITRYVTRKPVGVEAPADDVASRITVHDAASGAVLGVFSVESRTPVHGARRACCSRNTRTASLRT